MRISIAMLVLNVGLNLVFVRLAGMDVDGLALATALTSWGSLILLLPGLHKKLHLPRCQTAFVGPLARMVLAAAVSGAASLGAEALLVDLLGRALALMSAIGVGVVTYAVMAHSLRVPEAEAVRRRLTRRRST